MRRATRAFRPTPSETFISIHALREESDLHQFQHESLHIISIHALREESDATARMYGIGTSFQSTLSVRRATGGFALLVEVDFISIHALREESDRLVFRVCRVHVISIHALREESDAVGMETRTGAANFNPRSP